MSASWILPAAGPLAQAAVPRDTTLWEWLGDAGTWSGSTGILASLLDTVTLCAAVIAFCIALTLPGGSILAHQRRAPLLSAWLVNIGRAVPTFGIAAFLVPFSLRAGLGFEPWPIFVALVLLTLPPMFLSTYVAVRQVDPGAVSAGRAMGLSERQMLLGVELPLAAPVIATGIRVASVQVVATEPIRAFLGGDGLGRYVRDGIGQNNPTLTVGGTILIAALAGVTAVTFVLLERIVTPAGVRRARYNDHPHGDRDANETPDPEPVDGWRPAVGGLRR